MSAPSETARRIIGSLEADKPHTLIALIRHIDASLSEGLCPVCAGALETRAGSRLGCLACSLGMPAYPAGPDSVPIDDPEWRQKFVGCWRREISGNAYQA